MTLSMDTRLPIIQYWHSPEPPRYIAELIRSFPERNPNRPHILFNASTASEFIAEHFTAREPQLLGHVAPRRCRRTI